jgi:uncharacterized membrane protein YfcA
MTPIAFTLITFAISLVAGLLGSLLGLGGGLIVIPALTLLLHIDIRYAIGASVVCVIATSSGAAAAYVRGRMTNLRVAMLLEIATVSGALTGAFIAGKINPRWLFVLFGLIMGYSSIAMLRKRQEHLVDQVQPDSLATRLHLHGSFFDESLGKEVRYEVAQPTVGLALMYVAGVVSGLLGIGSGALKVPAMDLSMRLPIKVSTATSNFMMGVTAAASAGVYFARGDINPYIAAPVAAGVMIGATGGSRLLGKLQSRAVRIAFVIVVLFVSLQMLLKGLR